MTTSKTLLASAILAGAAFAGSAMANSCKDLPTAAELKSTLTSIATGPAANSGMGMPVWLSLLSTEGTVCAVVHSLPSDVDVTTELSMGHRIYSIHKANTSNAFSHSHISIATATLFTATQPGGALSSDASTLNAPIAIFDGDTKKFGTKNDPLIGKRVGGVTGLGGGLALFDSNKKKVGAIGVSGDTLCTDHVIAWKVREALKGGAYTVANVPFGISSTHQDQMVQDVTESPYGGAGLSKGTYGHPTCANNPTNATDGGSIEGN